MYQKLFTPIKIRDMELKNRIILPAMGTKFSGKGSDVTDQLIDYHVARVKGGTGLSIVEVCSVHTPSAPRGFLSISEDRYIPGMKRLTDAIHENGGKAGLQLWQGSICVGMDPTALILVASDMPVSAEMTIPGISKEMIAEVVECYGKAAGRAVQAGFDCVEIHMAHNYLPHSFLSGGINHRTDEYGGSFENRARFPLEIIHAVRANIPETMPVFMRIDAHDDYLENGLTIEEVIEFCKLAKAEGVDVLDVSRGNVISAGNKFEVPPIDLPRGFNIENAAKIRKETGMLTVGVGRINTAELAEQILEEDKVDMVVMGRAQLADPDFVKKSKEGRLDEINYCVGCDQGCLDGFANIDCPHITCLRNPAVGREKECQIVKAEKPETVLIAGGGIAGLEAAIILKERGHEPILCEATDTLGGQFLTAGEAPRKEEMKEAVLGMAKRAHDLGVDIRMNMPVTPELIAEIKPHTLINAIGSEPIIPNIPGARLPFVLNSHDVLDGKAKAEGNVVVIGGGMVGMEVAEYLAERGCKVTDLEMLKEFCADMGDARKTCVTESIYQLGITPVTEVTVTEIKEGEVIGTKDGQSVSYPCDYAVLAIGSRSRNADDLEAACREAGIAYFTAGDAGMARRALDAVREAFDVAITFDKPEVHAEASRPKKVVFLTGATGTMGQETMKQLLSRSSRFKTRILARPSEKNKALLKKYMCPALEIVWGDMADYDTILKCVTGADYVLHVGAMVSPMADDFPEKTLYTNIGSTLNIIKAIKEQPDPDAVHFAYVATVAMTGQRSEPIHFGRVGDPINPSIFDYYGISKVFSEMALYDSGLKHWVSIRQTGQHPSNEAAGELPIQTHQPPNNVLEWSTAIESGICMANICEDWVPESFWRKAYNLSSGAGYRMTTWELMDISLGAFGIALKDMQDSRMMAKYNFHGHYYTDADDLDNILHFRCIPAEAYWGGVREEMRRMAENPMIRAAFPTAEQMKQNIIRIGHKRMGTYWMFENNEENWIKAFFGSREQQAAIPAFDEGYDLHHPSEEPTYLDHGYDESKKLEDLTLDELKAAAKFRGGECLAEEVPDIYTPIKWKCADGHEFMMSVNAVLQGGHWCPECLKDSWAYGQIAKKNPFYAQVWWPIHDPGDDYVIPMEYSAYRIREELMEKLGL
ncbi:MAG: FAD-dependent oxidoreductase [Faecalicatena sp.]|uniref:bile acid Fe-S flavoenzyme BaiCD n=1 Tax=Faecalicatena sp. TaxID=2005360 RepID=UPI002586E53E|nr:FAD-dependent oxidoreductase [Faecalicatena sp.]MCI6465765.1 FAD-dependent oxidoreductase [Faecalicatena sp.]MDY5618821.1 FAD-dependent oxidoreductase [Lachnospiraceae bacterium]